MENNFIPQQKGFHALHGAAKKDLTKPIKFLIQKGHSVDVRAPVRK